MFPSYTKVVRGRGWLSVANVGKVAVKLRPQWKVATVECARQVRRVGVGSNVVEDNVDVAGVREFRKELGIQVD